MPSTFEKYVQSAQRGGLRWTAWLVLVLAVAATGWGWFEARRHEDRQDRDRFQLLAQRTEAAIVRRMETCETVARSAAAFVDASKSIERDEWSRFVRGLKLSFNRVGIFGLGYVERVPGYRIDDFIRETRADGAPDFEIYPPGDRDEYRIVKYCEPAEQNERAVGLDANTRPVVGPTMDLAGEEGRPRLTARLYSVQEPEGRPNVIL